MEEKFYETSIIQGTTARAQPEITVLHRRDIKGKVHAPTVVGDRPWKRPLFERAFLEQISYSIEDTP